MTYPFTPMGTGGPAAGERADARSLQGRPLLVRLHDEVRNFVTDKCPTGWKIVKGEQRPNNVVRASIADVTFQNPDGTAGKVYPSAIIFAGTLVKDLKYEVGKTKLIMWQQDATPVDPYGNPLQTNPYRITDMSGNQAAIDAARAFLAANPDFMEIPAPDPYVPQAPPPPYQQQQQQWGQQAQGGYQPPVQQQWQQQPPQSWGQPLQQQPAPQPQQQWQQQPPQQQPSPWNTAAPPPGYQPPQQPGYQAPQQQQWGQQPQSPWNTAAPPPGYQPPQQQQWGQQPQSFLAAAQGVPPQYQGQGPVMNHHGQPQPENPPY